MAGHSVRVRSALTTHSACPNHRTIFIVTVTIDGLGPERQLRPDDARVASRAVHHPRPAGGVLNSTPLMVRETASTKRTTTRAYRPVAGKRSRRPTASMPTNFPSGRGDSTMTTPSSTARRSFSMRKNTGRCRCASRSPVQKLARHDRTRGEGEPFHRARLRYLYRLSD